MANLTKGETDISLGEKDYTLNLSFRAMTEIETVLGLGIFELFVKAARGTFTLTEAAVIVEKTIDQSEAEKPLTLDQIGELLLKGGLTNSVEPIGAFFRIAVQGGAKKKPVRAPAKKAPARKRRRS